MSKRDYKSYNIFEEDIVANEVQTLDVDKVDKSAQETLIEENKIIEPKNKKDDEVVKDIQIQKDELESSIKVQESGIIQKRQGNKGVRESEIVQEIRENERVKENEIVQEIQKNERVQDIEDKIVEDKKIHKERSFGKSVLPKSVRRQSREKELHFPEYKRYYQQKKRSKLFKWMMLLAKLVILFMLLPLIAFVGAMALGVVGLFGFAIFMCVGIGILLIGSVAFMCTQISLSAIALGISLGITSIALGGMILIIFLYMVKWVKCLFKRYRKPHIKVDDKEEL
ncbi:MAG: hypothetical protein J6F30_01640 [Cellulosilyticum sp.]|nr:hypothetical protein [Cellulosilyticum sp.]